MTAEANNLVSATGRILLCSALLLGLLSCTRGPFASKTSVAEKTRADAVAMAKKEDKLVLLSLVPDGLLSADDRQRTYRDRRTHKEMVVFLHEWAHTLGVLHDEDPDSAHSRYNALVRRLVSFERAAECAS